MATEFRTGWGAVVDRIEHYGVDTVFGLPSDDLALLAALESRRVRMVLCRDQRNAVFMAIGNAIVSGLPGICAIGKGPAVTNALTGVLEARSAAVPLVLIATGTAAARRGTGAFQELDQLSVARPLVKWAARVEDAARVAPAVERAVFVATQGAPGPVYLELPEDIGTASVPGPDTTWRRPGVQRLAPDPQAVAAAVDMIRRSERPLVLVGGGARASAAGRAIERLVNALDAAVFATASGRGVVAETSPSFCGLAGLYTAPPASRLWTRTDLVVALGSRLEETATFGLERIPATPVVQVTLDEADVVMDRPGIAILGDVARTADELSVAAAGDRPAWAEEISAVREESHRLVTERLKAIAVSEDEGPAPRVPEVLAAVMDAVPPDRILVQENGLQDMWSYFFPYYVGAAGGFVAPSEQTPLGFGAAAAIGAKLAAPDRPVVALVGDGAFTLFRSDLRTAAEAGAGVLYVVLDNGGYGWLQSQLEQRSGTSRFRFRQDGGVDADSRVWSTTVRHRDQLLPALREALARCARDQPAVVVIPVKLDDTAPGLVDLAGDFPHIQEEP